MKIQTITINGNTFELSDPAVSVLEQTAQQLQNDVTVLKNNVDIIVSQAADSVLTAPQSLPEARQAQARANIGAMPEKISELKIHEVQVGTDQKELAEVTVSVDGVRNEDGTDVRSAIVEFTETHYDGPCVLRNIGEGVRDDDAATVGQVNASVAASVEPVAQAVDVLAAQTLPAIETLSAFRKYRKLCDKVEITGEDVAAAGEEGITCITIGSDHLDLTPYSEILIDFYIPKSDTINTADAGLQISATKTANESLAPDHNTLMRQGSTSITPATALTRQYKMYKTARIVWNNDGKFMYGQLHSGNFGSIGYPAAVAGWPYISESFNKNEKKYFHIFNAELAFKFPAGTWVELYGR